MMINRNLFKESESFKNVEKDLGYIISRIASDEKIMKLLSLQENKSENLSAKEKKQILEECVYIVPNIQSLNDKGWSCISVQFNNFTKNGENPEYRDKMLIFNVLCGFDTWNMGDFKLRPYQIAGRLDVLFDKKPLANSYSIRFLTAQNTIVDDDVAGISLVYEVIYNISGDKKEELD